METNFNEQVPPKREGFWKRQFSDSPSLAQKIFDVVMGIIAPILCLYFDPLIFKNIIFSVSCGDGNATLGQPLAIFAYTLIGLGMLALAIWLIAGTRLGGSAAFFAGIFFAGAESALALGVALLPLSVPALLFIIGILGFIPFLTAFVYLRNGVRAWRSARRQDPPKLRAWVFTIALMGALVIYLIPTFIQWQAWVLFPQTQIVEQREPCGSDE
jgi:hypothetical protein